MYTLRHHAIKIAPPIYLTKSGVMWQETAPGVVDSLKKSFPDGVKAAVGVGLDAAGAAADAMRRAIEASGNFLERRKKALKGDIAFTGEDTSGDLLATTLEAQALKKAILSIPARDTNGKVIMIESMVNGQKTKIPKPLYSEGEVDAMLMDGLQSGKEVDFVSQIMMRLSTERLIILKRDIIVSNNPSLYDLYATSTYLAPEDVDVRKAPSSYRFHKEVWFNVKGEGQDLWNFGKSLLGVNDMEQDSANKERILRELIVLRANYARDVIFTALSQDEISNNGKFTKESDVWFRDWRISPSDLGEAIKKSRGDMDDVKKKSRLMDGSMIQKDTLSALVYAAGNPGQNEIEIGGVKITIPGRDEVERLETIAMIIQAIHDGWAILVPTIAESIGNGFEKAAAKLRNITGGAIGPLLVTGDYITDSAFTVFLAIQAAIFASHAANGLDKSPVFNSEMGKLRKGLHATIGAPEWVGWKVTQFAVSRGDVTKGLTLDEVKELKTSGEYLDPDSEAFKEKINAARKEVRDMFRDTVVETTPSGTNITRIARTAEEIAEKNRRIERIDAFAREYKKAWIANQLNKLPPQNVIDYALFEEVDGHKGIPRIEKPEFIVDPEKRYEGAEVLKRSDGLKTSQRYSPVKIVPNPGTATTVVGKGMDATVRRVQLGTPTDVLWTQAKKALVGQRPLDDSTARMDRMTAGNTSEPFRVAATIEEDLGEGRKAHKLATGEAAGVWEFELKDANIRKQVAEIKIQLRERATYFRASVIHKTIGNHERELTRLSLELAKYPEKITHVISRNVRGEPTETEERTNPAWKEKSDAIKVEQDKITLLRNQLAHIQAPVDANNNPQELTKEVADRLVKEAEGKITAGLVEIERIKGVPLDIFEHDSSGKVKLNTSEAIHPEAFLTKLLKKVATASNFVKLAKAAK